MGTITLIILSIGLAMDAFAVSVCNGLCMTKIRIKDMLIVGAWFGGFQALMPLVGYFIGIQFQDYIEKYDHWIAFILLSLIGAHMIKESLSKEEEKKNLSLDAKYMFLMAIATSIDALAVGVTFAFLRDTNIVEAIFLIGIITFAISAAGVRMGCAFGSKYKNKAEIVGGIVLIGIGVKILFEHLMS